MILFLPFPFRDISLKKNAVSHRFLRSTVVANGAEFECVAEQEMAGMTRGRRAKTGLNARKESQGRLLTDFSGDVQKSLEAKLANLEARVVQLEERVDRLEGIAPRDY